LRRVSAITPRLTGRLVQGIYAAVGRSAVWFRKSWDRYLESGPEGLYDRRITTTPPLAAIV
jgi:hypothetical protein